MILRHATLFLSHRRYAGDVVSDRPDLLWDGRDFCVGVIDQRNRLLFSIVTLAIGASPPAPSGHRPTPP